MGSWRQAFHSGERLDSIRAQLGGEPRGISVSYQGGLSVCDMMTAVVLEEESGMDVPDGDIPNFLVFPKVFSLFRAIFLFLLIRMPHCPTWA